MINYDWATTSSTDLLFTLKSIHRLSILNSCDNMDNKDNETYDSLQKSYQLIFSKTLKKTLIHPY